MPGDAGAAEESAPRFRGVPVARTPPPMSPSQSAQPEINLDNVSPDPVGVQNRVESALARARQNINNIMNNLDMSPEQRGGSVAAEVSRVTRSMAPEREAVNIPAAPNPNAQRPPAPAPN